MIVPFRLGFAADGKESHDVVYVLSRKVRRTSGLLPCPALTLPMPVRTSAVRDAASGTRSLTFRVLSLPVMLELASQLSIALGGNTAVNDCSYEPH